MGWVGLAVLGVSPVAWAVQTVAVLPFSDLAGGKSRVGEAIRETVTSDLREISVLKVLERDRIDKVVVEQDLRAKVTTLDAVSMVRVGTLLGASLIVTGAYQRAGATVRLTARVVKVQTGEILGTAKVDGPVGELLSLQDRITGQLLSSAGIERTTVARKRPRVKSWRTYELYGDAVVEPDDTKRRKLLQLAVAEDPGALVELRGALRVE